jgi:hypothetical protein
MAEKGRKNFDQNLTKKPALFSLIENDNTTILLLFNLRAAPETRIYIIFL